MKIQVTNITSEDIYLDNLGLKISSDSTIDISEYADVTKIFDCDELKQEITNDNLLVLYDSTILSKIDSIDHLTIQTKYNNSYNDAPLDLDAYVRKNKQQKKLKEEIGIQNDYILYGYLNSNYILSSSKQNNLNKCTVSTAFNNNEYFNYDTKTGKITILKSGKYFFSYNLLIYNLINEKNICYSQILHNNNTVNGSLLTCYLEKIKYNVRNRINKDEYMCNTIKDSMPILCNDNDEIIIQVKSNKSCKIDSRGTKFIINKIG